MRVLITDCDSKHSIALQRHIRDALPDIHLVRHFSQSIRYARYLTFAYADLSLYPCGFPVDTL